MNIAACIQHLFPDARPGIDFIVVDRLDGNGPCIEGWNLETAPPTEEELAAVEDQVEFELAAASRRSERDTLLLATDWTQLPDVPEATRSRWTAYRQALRDLPAQPGWPFDVQIPQAPEV